MHDLAGTVAKPSIWLGNQVREPNPSPDLHSREWPAYGPDHPHRPAATRCQRRRSTAATAPRNCVPTVNSPIFRPISFPMSAEKR
jgi:hypothetical protein